MPYCTRPISIKALVAVSRAILSYVDEYGCCTACNASLSRRSGLGLATVRACVAWLIDAGVFYAVYNWMPKTQTVRTLTLPTRPERDWRGSKISGMWVDDPFD